MIDILEQLNSEQREAVKSVEGPLLVLAGAGSGKTRVVTLRIIHLLQMGVNPSQILGLTFTNKAAQEMRERVNTITQSHVLISTFHSLGARLLRECIHVLGYKHDFNIYDDEDVNKLLRTCFADKGIDDPKKELKEARRFISNAKNDLLDLEDLSTKHGSNLLYTQIFRSYQEKLKEYNAVDFDDLLFLPVKILREFAEIRQIYQHRWSFLLIDEFQDTNEAQYALVKFLVEKTGNLCVVGDPDQSIYSWRGANIQNIMNFEIDFSGAKVIRLEQNYRSRKNILDASNAVIRCNETRYEKNLWCAKGEGEKIKHFIASNEKEEADYVADRLRVYQEQHGLSWNHMVVFYRTHAQSRVFEDLFYLRRIPYMIMGGVSFYQRREIKDILAFLKIVLSGTDYLSFARTINLPKRGIGETTLEKIRQGASEEYHSIFSYCEALANGDPLHTSVRLTAKQKQGLVDYVEIIRMLRKVHQEGTLRQLVEAAIQYSQYLGYLREDQETFTERKENLDALVAKAAEWELSYPEATLPSFLEELSLKSNLDESDSSKERVHLMTIHNGKGLEYDAVFLVGLEEDLFPHVNSRESSTALEEERRLFYVGMTRAKEYLYLTNARQRFLWGSSKLQRASRFLKEIPLEYIEEIKCQRAPQYQVKRSYQAQHQTLDDFETVEDEPFSDEGVQVIPEISEEVFQKGEFVFHNDFGIGVIQSVYQSSMGLTYKILFSKDDRERSLIAKIARLKKL